MTETEIAAQDAHEAQHRADFWNLNRFRMTEEQLEARGFAAEVPAWDKRIKELEAKGDAMTDAERNELKDAKDQRDNAAKLSDPEGEYIKAYCRNRQ